MSSLPAPPPRDPAGKPSADPAKARPSGRFGRRLPSGRHGLPRAFVSRNQRERVIDAVAHVVAEKGFVATRVVDITDRAGVSRKTFYELFTDKEDAFLTAFDTVASLMFGHIARAFEEGGDQRPWIDHIRSGMTVFLSLLAAEPAFARMCLVEAKFAGPQAQVRIEDSKARFRSYLAGGRSEPEELATIPDLAEDSIVAEMYERIESKVLSRDAEDLPELVEPYLELVKVLWFGRP